MGTIFIVYRINTEWYRTSLRTRKGIYFMLIRSRKPCMLTAANMFNVSMETFSAVRIIIFFFFFIIPHTNMLYRTNLNLFCSRSFVPQFHILPFYDLCNEIQINEILRSLRYEVKYTRKIYFYKNNIVKNLSYSYPCKLPILCK